MSPTRLALSSISKSHDSYSELWLWLVYRRANKRRRCICPFIYNYIYKICLSFNFLMLQKYTFFLKKTSTGHIFWLNRHEKAREQNRIPCASAAHTGASRKAQQVGKNAESTVASSPKRTQQTDKIPHFIAVLRIFAAKTCTHLHHLMQMRAIDTSFDFCRKPADRSGRQADTVRFHRYSQDFTNSYRRR